MVLDKTIIHVNTSGNIIGVGISEDVYMRDYADQSCEWLDGTVIKMSPVHDKHNMITQYLIILLNAYFEHKSIGELRTEPFVMRYSFEDNGETKWRNREPDLQIILDGNPHELTPTYMNGVADIVIEVVSPESQQRDYAEKYYEYEQAGVPEYWIIDPIRKEARFYLLNDKRAYILQTVDDEYQTTRLPRLTLHIPTLWHNKLPGPSAIVKTVSEMLA